MPRMAIALVAQLSIPEWCTQFGFAAVAVLLSYYFGWRNSTVARLKVVDVMFVKELDLF
jgi:hypothetical protein